jgi:2-iminoacetate synthase
MRTSCDFVNNIENKTDIEPITFIDHLSTIDFINSSAHEDSSSLIDQLRTAPRIDSMTTYSTQRFDQLLASDLLNLEDLPVLLSKMDSKQLEQLALRANRESQSYHGKTVQLFTPLYLGNYCENQCIYCAFNSQYKVKRKKLSYVEVINECEWVKATGLDEILLLTGESRKHTDVAYISECSRIASKYFNSVGIEIYPLEVHEYKTLIEAGVTSLTLYQETYDESRYDALHLAGPKKDYSYRLGAPERGAIAGMNKIQIGALLGLADPLEDAYKTAMHLTYLMNHYPEVEWGLSLPRLKDIENGSFIGNPVEDRLFVQILLAFRVLFPKVSISISTREDKGFREQLIPLGVTKLSAGVSTSVGRLTKEEAETKQFEISDESSVEEVKAMVSKKGYQVVMKNWVRL